MKLSEGEKIIIELLADIHNKLGLKESRANPILKAISTGNVWSVDKSVTEVSTATSEETFQILEMWRSIESGYASFSKSEKQEVLEATGVAEAPKFTGFDGNNEEHFGVAKYIIEQMGRYDEFKNRHLNSHRRMLDGYKRMLAAYKKFGVSSNSMTSKMMIEILNS